MLAVVATVEATDTAHPAAAVVAPAVPQEPSEWINQASAWVGDKNDTGRFYRETIVSDPMTTIEDCEQQLNQKMMVAVGRFVDTNFDEEGSRDRPSQLLRLAQDLRLTPGMIRAEIVGDTFVEDYDSIRLGRTMKRVHMRLHFDQAVQEDLQRRLQEFEAQKEARWAMDNLIAVCLITLAVLAVLGVVYALLQFDTATKGYYTKRMLVGGAVVAVLLAIFVAIGAS